MGVGGFMNCIYTIPASQAHLNLHRNLPTVLESILISPSLWISTVRTPRSAKNGYTTEWLRAAQLFQTVCWDRMSFYKH